MSSQAEWTFSWHHDIQPRGLTQGSYSLPGSSQIRLSHPAPTKKAPFCNRHPSQRSTGSQNSGNNVQPQLNIYRTTPVPTVQGTSQKMSQEGQNQRNWKSIVKL